MPTYENVIPLSQASFSGKLPRKPHNQAVRSREYLTEAEVGKLMKAARNYRSARPPGCHTDPDRLPPRS